MTQFLIWHIHVSTCPCIRIIKKKSFSENRRIISFQKIYVFFIYTYTHTQSFSNVDVKYSSRIGIERPTISHFEWVLVDFVSHCDFDIRWILNFLWVRRTIFWLKRELSTVTILPVSKLGTFFTKVILRVKKFDN